MSWICQECGYENSDDLTICEKCGAVWYIGGIEEEMDVLQLW